jgi:hypothetical protein
MSVPTRTDGEMARRCDGFKGFAKVAPVTSGGSRFGSGPLPDPESLRQDRMRASGVGGWINLPAEGRTGTAPPWPLRPYVAQRGQDGAGVTASEAAHWAAAWATPQSVVWEQIGWTHDVALMCRMLALAEGGLMAAASEARQWSDRLGLNPPAMARYRWRIVEERLPIGTAGPTARDRMRARDRLEAMDGDQLRPRRLRAPGYPLDRAQVRAEKALTAGDDLDEGA